MDNTSAVRRKRAVTIGVSGWAAIVTLVFLWQTISYVSIVALAAEWQFNLIGEYYPVLTNLALVALFAVPVILVLRLVRRHRRRAGVRGGIVDLPTRENVIERARIFRRVLLGAAATLALAALVTLVVMLFLPSSRGVPQLVTPGTASADAPVEGPTTLDATFLYQRTAGLEENLLFARRDFRFAAAVAPGNTTRDLRFFVELPGINDPGRRADMRLTGVLKRNALPGEIVRLFRYVGYRVEKPYYVVFTSETAMRWPYLVMMVEFILAGLLFLICGLFQWRHVRRLERVDKS